MPDMAHNRISSIGQLLVSYIVGQAFGAIEDDWHSYMGNSI